MFQKYCWLSPSSQTPTTPLSSMVEPTTSPSWKIRNQMFCCSFVLCCHQLNLSKSFQLFPPLLFILHNNSLSPELLFWLGQNQYICHSAPGKEICIHILSTCYIPISTILKPNYQQILWEISHSQMPFF